MGKAFDKTGISFRSETWAMLAEHLYDGAFGMAFASSRGWHRLACAIEDAGLVIHPSIFGWAFGSGFPKATRIDTQVDRYNGDTDGREFRFTKWMRSTGLTARRIDEITNTKMGSHYTTHTTQPAIPTAELWKMLRPHCGDIPSWVDELVERIEAEREVIGKQTKGSSPLPGNHNGTWADNQNDGEYNLTVPATPLARAWVGHRYGLQALKPALEPIIVFQKPYRGKPVDCITRTGAGALNIDGTRIGTDAGWDYPNGAGGNGFHGGVGRSPDGTRTQPVKSKGGKWAANLVLSHSPSCNGTCVDGCAVRRLGEQSGVSTSNGGTGATTQSIGGRGAYQGGDNRGYFHLGDTGTAARFFFQSDWSYEVAEQLANADPVRYQAKASRSERNAGLEHLPERERTTQGRDIVTTIDRKDGKGRVPVNAKIQPAQNHHPTVKPIALARWLATLLLPPAVYAPRRILVPFSGSGSEMIGAMLAGWEEIIGIEMDAEYCKIAEARLVYWGRCIADAQKQPMLLGVE